MNTKVETLKEKAPVSCTTRVAKGRERVIRTRPSVDLDKALIMTQNFKTTEGEPWVIRKAKAFREQCRKKKIFIQEDELIVGTPGSKIRAGILAPDVCWTFLEEELETIDTREVDPFLISVEDKQVFLEEVKPFWQGRSLREAWLARVPDDLAQACIKTGVIDVDGKAENGPGEFTSDYEWLLNAGIQGIRKRIQERLARLEYAVPGDYEKITYLNALLISCEGIEILAQRYADLADHLAKEEKDSRRQAELNEIANTCRRVPACPARTFREALQSLWFYQICLHMEMTTYSYNPGRMDQYLFPFYQKDLSAGILNPDQAQEFLECLWVKFAEICILWSLWKAYYIAGYQTFQKICCGGVTRTGEDAVNDLSYMMIQASMNVRLSAPDLAVKYHRGKNPDAFLLKAAEAIALGTGIPPIFNDELGMRMIMDEGADAKEAYNWNPCGCVEMNLAGKSAKWTDLSKINLGSAVEHALTNGRGFLKNASFPAPRTGNPAEFNDFEQLKQAVKRQIGFQIRKIAEAGQILMQLSEELRPLPVASLTFADCIEKCRDYQAGGPKYNPGPGAIGNGIADLVDSLAAVKHLVLDEKVLTWHELLQALKDNFQGHEDIRQVCLRAPKYGNDIDWVDKIAAEMFQFQAEAVRQYGFKYDGRLSSGLFPVTSHVPLGKYVGALPSGRRAGAPLADGVSPMQGADVKGPTAVLKSVSKINHAMHTSGTLLNLKFDPAYFADKKGLSNFAALVKSMCNLGIYHLQCNVVSTETLKKAQENPEDYRDLIVRVAGYSAYFVELAKPIQDDLMARTTQYSRL